MSHAPPIRHRLCAALTALVFSFLALFSCVAVAQEAASSGDSATAASAGAPGEVGQGIKKALDKMNGLRSGLIQAAVGLSERTRADANKIAFGLGVITLVFAGLRFAATSDAVSAWTDLFETFLVVGIFASLYASYTSFAPGLFVWFNDLAQAINGGIDIYNVPISLARAGGSFYDSVLRTLLAGFANPLKMIDAVVSAILFGFAFIAVLISALIYSWFILVGHLQVAVGIVVGPLAVAFGMADISRKYFTAWLDYMVTGSMYMVVAAIISQLVSATLLSIVTDVGNIGTDTLLAASYALSIAILLGFVALEIPKIAGSLFGTGGGVSGTGGTKMLGRGAWNLGRKLAGK